MNAICCSLPNDYAICFRYCAGWYHALDLAQRVSGALRGPTIPDRVVALDNITINLVAAIIVISIRAQSALYIDVALVLAILSFLGTVAAAKYLLRGTVIDGSPLHTRPPG